MCAVLSLRQLCVCPPTGAVSKRLPHVLNSGRSTPTSTLPPSIRACATANGIRRRSRRYKSVWKTVFGTDDNRRKAIKVASKVNGMKTCCSDQANATNTIARLVLRWSRRRSQGEDGRNKRLRSNSTSSARKQHQRRPAPCQRRRVPMPKEGVVGVRLQSENNSVFAKAAQATLARHLERAGYESGPPCRQVQRLVWTASAVITSATTAATGAIVSTLRPGSPR